MPERMQFDFVPTDDPRVGIVETNLSLTAGEPEHYPTLAAAEDGSYLAQLLAEVRDLTALTIERHQIKLWRAEDADWEALASEVIAILREEFL